MALADRLMSAVVSLQAGNRPLALAAFQAVGRECFFIRKLMPFAQVHGYRHQFAGGKQIKLNHINLQK